MKLIVVVLTGVLFTTGCVHIMHDCLEGSGKVVIQDRPLDGAYGIDFRTSGTVEVTRGPKYALSVEAEENLQKYITTEVHDQTLVISSKECFRTDKPMVFRVTMPDVRALDLSGSGKIIGKNRLQTDKLFVVLTGSGEMKIDAEATVLRNTLSGSGDIHLRGSAKDHEIKISGSGTVQAQNLDARNVTVRISGSGDCTVNASELLRVAISGSGNVRYVGKPGKIESKVTGSGNVMQLR